MTRIVPVLGVSRIVVGQIQGASPHSLRVKVRNVIHDRLRTVIGLNNVLNFTVNVLRTIFFCIRQLD